MVTVTRNENRDLPYAVFSHAQCYRLCKLPGHFISTLGNKYTVTGLTLKVLVTTIDAQWEGMGDAGSARYEPALLPPCLTIRVLSYSN